MNWLLIIVFLLYGLPNIKGLHSKLHITAGCISDNLILDSVTYMARCKYS